MKIVTLIEFYSFPYVKRQHVNVTLAESSLEIIFLLKKELDEGKKIKFLAGSFRYELMPVWVYYVSENQYYAVEADNTQGNFPGLPEIRNWYDDALEKWIKENGENFERLLKMKIFL